MHLPLLVWLSPGFPVGGFAYSHGLEWAHEAGDVADAAALEAWLADLLAFGSAPTDAILFAESHRAATRGDAAALADLAELGLALAGAAERRLETGAQGDAFRRVARAAWPSPADALLPEAPLPYPVAVAATAAGHGVPLDAALPAFVLAFLANLVSAGLRLGILGQTDGQRILAALLPRAEACAREAAGAGLDGLGAAAFRSDLAALRHETQYTRLFRS